MTDIKTVGVIGAGQMGSGIAHVCALGGYDVLLHDVSRERIDAGIGPDREEHEPPGGPRPSSTRRPWTRAMARIKPAPSCR
jgi:3-hydroxybutyryl-CoA dehydrogenase